MTSRSYSGVRSALLSATQVQLVDQMPQDAVQGPVQWRCACSNAQYMRASESRHPRAVRHCSRLTARPSNKPHQLWHSCRRSSLLWARCCSCTSCSQLRIMQLRWQPLRWHGCNISCWILVCWKAAIYCHAHQAGCQSAAWLGYRPSLICTLSTLLHLSRAC